MLLNKIQNFINIWWPWINFFNDIFLIQFFMLLLLIYTYTYTSVYYTLLYTFILFFLVGISLSMFQVELFTAFLWLIECSVLFVFLLLLFYLNIKNTYNFNNKQYYVFVGVFFFIVFVLVTGNTNLYDLLSVYYVFDNLYEAFNNQVQNDLFLFSVSYYSLNIVEFFLIGFLLLVGSIICVNLYQFNKNVRVQNYNSFFNIFNFFNNFVGFLFLRKQNLTKQGNTKASTKIFKKK